MTTRVRFTTTQIRNLLIEYQDEPNNIWLGINYKFFKAWLEKKFGASDVFFDRSGSVLEFTISENCTKEATFLLLNNYQINDL
jgi:hypothetical protein